MQHRHGPLSAAVLAGGRSRRMGQDKALLPLTAGGPPMLALVLERLRQVAADVIIVSERRAGYDAFGAPVVPDDFPDAGALGGIATALRHAAHDHCLVVACDMPFLSLPLLRRLAAEPRDYGVLAPRLPGESRQGGAAVYQTLHAVYARACLDPIRAQLAEGNRQVIGFFPRVRVRTIEADEVRRFDPELRSFVNANTPAALAAARAMAAGDHEARSQET
jgi:molybdenum cofactor guanylyltransferase